MFWVEISRSSWMNQTFCRKCVWSWLCDYLLLNNNERWFRNRLVRMMFASACKGSIVANVVLLFVLCNNYQVLIFMMNCLIINVLYIAGVFWMISWSYWGDDLVLEEYTVMWCTMSIYQIETTHIWTQQNGKHWLNLSNGLEGKVTKASFSAVIIS